MGDRILVCHVDRWGVEVVELALRVARQHREGVPVVLIPKPGEEVADREVVAVGESRHRDCSL